MATMDITEGSFQTPASKKRKALGSPSLPPASQPITPPSNFKNRTPLIATGIDPKFNTAIRIISELRQYHPSLRVFQIRHSKKVGFLYKILLRISLSCRVKPKWNKFLGQKLRCHYQSHITLQTPQKPNIWSLREYQTTFQLTNLKNCLISTK